ncbi:MAG TPA: hypothetical protein VFA71_07390 [Terriglobales bacterium]|nr:hypothetical protein [Terriglobales bacterium]
MTSGSAIISAAEKPRIKPVAGLKNELQLRTHPASNPAGSWQKIAAFEKVRPCGMVRLVSSTFLPEAVSGTTGAQRMFFIFQEWL